MPASRVLKVKGIKVYIYVCVCSSVCVCLSICLKTYSKYIKILLKHHLFISHSMSLENTAAPSRKFTSSHSPKFGSLVKLGYKTQPKNWTTTKHQWSFKTLRKLMVVWIKRKRMVDFNLNNHIQPRVSQQKPLKNPTKAH